MPPTDQACDFARLTTPLDAPRTGVLDYLDKNQELTRETFLAAVRKQLDRIAPAKRQREFICGDALDVNRDAVRHAPERADTHLLLGRLLRRPGRQSEAAASLRNAPALNPDLPEARKLLEGPD